MNSKKMPTPRDAVIRLRGVHQHNLKHLDLDIPLFRLIAISGVSGSGKSSLALHTLYAEGQRRYVETFSPYARQFLERMNPPQAELVEGIPPAIAIESGTAVRSSRSTVGTITEINDHLKILYARLAIPHCPQCGRPVSQDTPESILETLADIPSRSRVLIAFPYRPETDRDWPRLLISQGFLRIYQDGKTTDLETLSSQDIDERNNAETLVVVDRIPWGSTSRERLSDSLDTAFRMGQGRLAVIVLPEEIRWFSFDLSCPYCRIPLPAATPNLFSFNSPLGACPDCRGFGRTIGLDLDLVIPDPRLSLREGAVKPWSPDRTEYEDLLRFCRNEGIPVDVPYEKLSEEARRKIIEGTDTFYGVKGFFEWLEGRTYKMHVRVFLSRYRAYIPCKTCGGSRYQPNTLLYRLWGVTLDTLCAWSVERCYRFFEEFRPELEKDPAAALVADEIRNRLRFLRAVGLEYLSLDRQSRTLSGGEVQRVHLTRALGSALVNVLYILDEPSVGLHARDQERLMAQLAHLVRIGNSVVVVEHDPDMIRFCDEVIDMGPGGGERGGEVLYQGPPQGLAHCPASLTGIYLKGLGKPENERQDSNDSTPLSHFSSKAPLKRRLPDWDKALVLKGARENNLKNLTARFPLGLLIGISGVSGSGKSTLIEKTLYANWLRAAGKPIETPGLCDGLEGVGDIEEMILVDQQPIGRTPRANLLTYTKVLDPLRKLLAQTPEAQVKGYSAKYFSFNVPGGRCERCRGEGFERVEMQFLADVMIRCPQCNGRRFKDEILDIRVRGLSIGDMLECTAQELLERFADQEPIVKALEPVVTMGLDYLRLGQPLSGFSGGEAQRLKLIRYLTEKSKKGRGEKGKMFLLDEPTTGLHPHDLQKLLNVLHRLVDGGHTVVVVEHNLDCLRSCDWIIDLGPEGGEQGGEIVITGSPEVIANHPQSHTGRYLARESVNIPSPQPLRLPASQPSQEIIIKGAFEHNLQLEEIRIPRNQMVVITGLSGSGKSTLAFDVLFAEGQRRYLECLSTYVRQYFKILEKPDVDQILGVPPTVAIEQRSSQLGRRSTVGTITEIYHFLRLLYSKLGKQHCPDCGQPLEALSYDQILAMVEREVREHPGKIWAPLIRGRKGIYRDIFMRLRKMGLDTVRVDGVLHLLEPFPILDRYREHDIEVLLWNGPYSEALAEKVRRALAMGGGSFILEGKEKKVYSEHLYCPHCRQGLAPLDPRLFSFNSRHGACPHCEGIGTIHRLNPDRLVGAPDIPLKDGLVRFLTETPHLKSLGKRLERQWKELPDLDFELSFDHLKPETQKMLLYGQNGKSLPGLIPLLEQIDPASKSRLALTPFYEDVPCPQCGGQRLNPQARSVFVQGWPIGELVHLNVSDFQKQWESLRFAPEHTPISAPISKEIRERLFFLRQVGLDYLELDRSGETLSGGETQRIRLAAQLGSNLRGVCYILDEPTIGLHPADNERLLESLDHLREKGNTIVIVEHDTDTMKQADLLIELGPEAGRNGGRIIAQGSFDELCRNPDTLTGQWFGNGFANALPDPHHSDLSGKEVKFLEIFGACARNLKNIDIRIPLGTLTCITGVSGSGKSTLVHEVIAEELRQRLGKTYRGYRPVLKAMTGHEQIHRVPEVDHNPIGRTPRSTPATYVGIWDEIRKLFASLPQSRARGFSPGRFSFNVRGGRCEACQGQGEVRVEMNFLPDVSVPCEICGGKRFNEETLAIRFKEKNIADVLDMTMEEASRHFEAFPKIVNPLNILKNLGLGYLTLGQSSPTLSGGEAQRIKLAGELGSRQNHTLYILDEPTTGLHRADIQRLLNVLRILTDKGHTVLVIEHNLDFIRASDYVIDLGPGSGEAGGYVTAEGSPAELLLRADRSATARALLKWKEEMNL